MASAQNLGRFGYVPFPEVPGFHLNATGYRASLAGSDTFRFDRPLTGFSGYAISDRSALSMGPYYDACPSQFRYNLRAPGFEMYFPRSVRLWLGSLQSPIISWGEGSAGADVPTPPSKWFLVSFEDGQPPVLLVFQDSPAQLVIRGSTGKWSITTRPGYRGWVRVCLPLGHERSGSLTAASLGSQVAKIKEDMEFWTQAPPILEGFSVKADEEGLTAIWKFDRPGAMVPAPVLLAKAGGYPIQVLTGIKPISADLIDGPVAYSIEPRLAVRFPMKRVPFGRSLTLGPRPTSPFGETSPFGAAALSNLALEALLPDRSPEVVALAQSATDEYYARTRRFLEPYTKQRLPYDQGGDGLEVVAAHALLQAARAVGGESKGNSDDPFLQVAQRVDWATWTVWASDDEVSRKSSAIFSVASALSSDPERRALGAMVQAGLAAQRALSVYREGRRFPGVRPELTEPLFTLRDGIYLSKNDEFIASLLSEVRITSHQRIIAEQVSEGVLIKFFPEGRLIERLVFEIGRPVTVEPASNLTSLKSTQALGTLTINCTTNGSEVCSFLIKSPGWAVPLPVTVAPPIYSESR